MEIYSSVVESQKIIEQYMTHRNVSFWVSLLLEKL